jgi:hypothetical protein
VVAVTDFGTQSLTLLIPLGTFLVVLVLAFLFRRQPSR